MLDISIEHTEYLQHTGYLQYLHTRYDTGQWYTKMTVAQLMEAVPDFDWVTFLNTIGPGTFTPQDQVVCYALPYLQVCKGFNQRNFAEHNIINGP